MHAHVYMYAGMPACVLELAEIPFCMYVCMHTCKHACRCMYVFMHVCM